MSDERNESAQAYPLLSGINSPADLKALSPEQMKPLADEIRAFLVEKVSKQGGHLASNLGVVEMTLAIHRVFSSPKDHIIFDVGHQSYTHKILTGRRDAFDGLRQGGGISGFPKRSESEHDCFGTGHSSTSLSAAIGFAEADRLSGSDAYTICVFGDGAYTGGMIHEALNNTHKKMRLIIILNENEMSISKNIGRFAKHLSNLRSSKSYLKTKKTTASVLTHLPLIGKPLFRLLVRIKAGIKAVLYGSNYFEKLGLNYYGPADGNDEAAVERLLREAKTSAYSSVIHLKTVKGKGYFPAETAPDVYHGMAPAGCEHGGGATFSEEMGNTLSELADRNAKICAVTAAMTSGTGLKRFRSTHPERFFDVGIAEEHAVTFAAGLAANGYRPVVAIYSTFLQRAFDNVIHDVALQNLPVIFCIDRAGLNASDGATHHGIFDVAFLSEIPNMKIYTPITREGLRLALTASLREKGPVAVRYPNGRENPDVVAAFYGNGHPTEPGVRSDFAQTGKAPEAVIVTHGRMASEAIAAEKILGAEGIATGVLLLEQLKPYRETAAMVQAKLPASTRVVLFAEEEVRAGGMGMMLSDALLRQGALTGMKFDILALEDSFGIQKKIEPILHSFGLDAEGMADRIRKMLNR